MTKKKKTKKLETLSLTKEQFDNLRFETKDFGGDDKKCHVWHGGSVIMLLESRAVDKPQWEVELTSRKLGEVEKHWARRMIEHTAENELG